MDVLKLLEEISRQLDQISSRTASSGMVIDELKWISSKMEEVARDAGKIQNSGGTIDFGMGIITVLLSLILWRVW